MKEHIATVYNPVTRKNESKTFDPAKFNPGQARVWLVQHGYEILEFVPAGEIVGNMVNPVTAVEDTPPAAPEATGSPQKPATPEKVSKATPKAPAPRKAAPKKK